MRQTICGAAHARFAKICAVGAALGVENNPSKKVCTELWGASNNVFGRVKPKKIDGESAWRHCWTHWSGLGP